MKRRTNATMTLCLNNCTARLPIIILLLFAFLASANGATAAFQLEAVHEGQAVVVTNVESFGTAIIALLEASDGTTRGLERDSNPWQEVMNSGSYVHLRFKTPTVIRFTGYDPSLQHADEARIVINEVLLPLPEGKWPPHILCRAGTNISAFPATQDGLALRKVVSEPRLQLSAVSPYDSLIKVRDSDPEFIDLLRTIEKANSGDAEAQLKLGMMYYNGGTILTPGASRSFWKGRIQFEKAAKQGNVEAQYVLGWYYEKAVGALAEDNKVKALSWYLRAARQGNEKAAERVAQLRLSMPAADVQKAERDLDFDRHGKWLLLVGGVVGMLIVLGCGLALNRGLVSRRTQHAGTESYDVATPERHREFFLWTASWPMFLLFYIFSAVRHIAGDVFPNVLFLVGGAGYTVIQTWMSTTFTRATLRILALASLMAVGCWDRALMAVGYGVFYFLILVITAGVHAIIIRVKGPVQYPASRPHARFKLIWIGVPMAALVWALLLRSILMARFATTVPGGTPFGGGDLVAYSIRPSVIQQFVVLGWVGALIFMGVSCCVLLAHRFSGNRPLLTSPPDSGEMQKSKSQT